VLVDFGSEIVNEVSDNITFVRNEIVRAYLNLGSGGPLHQIGWNWSTLGYPAKYKSAIESATCSTPASTEFLSEGSASSETTSCHGCK
jgi:hypothetical protein